MPRSGGVDEECDKKSEFWAVKRLKFFMRTEPYCECISECSSHEE